MGGVGGDVSVKGRGFSLAWPASRAASAWRGTSALWPAWRRDRADRRSLWPPPRSDSPPSSASCRTGADSRSYRWETHLRHNHVITSPNITWQPTWLRCSSSPWWTSGVRRRPPPGCRSCPGPAWLSSARRARGRRLNRKRRREVSEEAAERRQANTWTGSRSREQPRAAGITDPPTHRSTRQQHSHKTNDKRAPSAAHRCRGINSFMISRNDKMLERHLKYTSLIWKV